MIKWNEKWGMWEIVVCGYFKFMSRVYRDVFFWVKYADDIDYAFAEEYFREFYDIP